MNDRVWILLGLIVFLVAVTSPVWYTPAAGGNGARPTLDKPVDTSQCVEAKAWMTANHMQLLNEWRDHVVRNGKATYTSKATGQEHEMSLSKTCLKCHTKREEFCNKCHDYADVHPRCWDCHVDLSEN